ncbi:MAG: hypothetical protein ACREFL_12135 [Stellaceae bacterium]
MPILNPAGISNDEYKEALILSLRANHLLAENPAMAKYIIDATLDFENSGVFDKEVDGKVDYRVMSTTAHVVLTEKTILSKAMTKSQLKENAGVVIALLFTSRQENEGAWEATYLVSARENLAKFFDALSKWTPPAQTEAPKLSEVPPHSFVIPTSAFPEISPDYPL